MGRVINKVEITERNRFSEFVHPKDDDGRIDLLRWLKWFEECGINAAMVFTDKGIAVYRDGLKDIFDDDDDPDF
jgi:hypothetical protein